MTTQPQLEMLPMTRQEIAEAFLAHFEAEVEKRQKSVTSANDKLTEALKLREMAEHEVARHAGESVGQEAADIVNSGALDTGDMQVTASVSPAVDPITVEFNEWCEPITGEVRTIYPGEKHAHITDVGDRTQYGELVADYLATLPAVSPHRNDPVTYYRVIGVDDEIDRDLRSPVSPDDYGVELAVVRLVDASEVNEPLEDAVR